MTDAKAKIWVRLIHKGQKTINDVSSKDRNKVREAYKELYGEEI